MNMTDGSDKNHFQEEKNLANPFSLAHIFQDHRSIRQIFAESLAGLS